jgi:hypothetical protein
MRKAPHHHRNGCFAKIHDFTGKMVSGEVGLKNISLEHVSGISTVSHSSIYLMPLITSLTSSNKE